MKEEHLVLLFNAYNKLTEGIAGVSCDDWFNGQAVTNFMFAKFMLLMPPSEERLAQLKAI